MGLINKKDLQVINLRNSPNLKSNTPSYLYLPKLSIDRIPHAKLYVLLTYLFFFFFLNLNIVLWENEWGND